MPLGWLFWMIYILCIVFSWWTYYEPAQPAWFRRPLGITVLWILIGILGYRVFGSAVK